MTTGKVVEYQDQGGISPFARWFARLDPVAAAKVTTALYRMEQGGLVILLGGGVKKGQQADIQEAKRCWREYKSRKLGRRHADHP